MKYRTIPFSDEDFPDQLRHITDPPKQLYWAGSGPSEMLTKKRVAVVGSRKLTAYGRQVTTELVQAMVAHGLVIISGLALGIDAVAHRSALDAGGLTVAVLPTSLANIYPASNVQLGHRILNNRGALVTEYTADSPFMYKYNFVARNRLISGLADAVLITEAAAGSGSLHTADFALQQGRDVMVVPGNITSPTSVGTNNLLKMGATPVTDVIDILRTLNIDTGNAPRHTRTGATKGEQLVLDLLDEGVHDGEALLERSQLPIGEFNQTITSLEISGSIHPGGANTWY